MTLDSTMGLESAMSWDRQLRVDPWPALASMTANATRWSELVATHLLFSGATVPPLAITPPAGTSLCFVLPYRCGGIGGTRLMVKPAQILTARELTGSTSIRP